MLGFFPNQIFFKAGLVEVTKVGRQSLSDQGWMARDDAVGR